VKQAWLLCPSQDVIGIKPTQTVKSRKITVCGAQRKPVAAIDVVTG